MKTIACLATSGLVLLSALIAVTAVGASEDGEQPDLVAYNCREFVAYPDVAYKAADDLVPENYTVIHDRLDPNEEVPGFGTLEDPTADTAKLFIASRHCERLEGFGKTDTDLIESYIAVPIKPPASRPRPSGVRPSGSSIEYPQPLENYLVQWVTNSELRARWLREAAGFGPDKVVVSDDIAFVYDAWSSAPVQSLRSWCLRRRRLPTISRRRSRSLAGCPGRRSRTSGGTVMPGRP